MGLLFLGLWARCRCRVAVSIDVTAAALHLSSALGQLLGGARGGRHRASPIHRMRAARSELAV